MKLGINDEGMKRIAKFVIRSQERLVAESVEKFADSSGGYVQGGTYDEIMGFPIERLINGQEVTPEEAMVVLNEGFSANDLNFNNEELDDLLVKYEGATVTEVLEAAQEKGVRGGTTYDWGWWGPEVTFLYFGGEIYDGRPAIVLASTGVGIDREPYMARIDGYEDLAWEDWFFSAVIHTNRGDIKVLSTDKEAYSLTIYEDETGTFEEDEEVIAYDDLANMIEELDSKFWR